LGRALATIVFKFAWVDAPKRGVRRNPVALG